MLKPLQYIFLNLVQKHNLLNFLQTKIFFAVDKIIIIFVLVNAIELVEQFLSLNYPIQLNFLLQR